MPDMSRPESSFIKGTTRVKKTLRDSTAAYVASQPLFDALRHGVLRTGEQASKLTIARNVVQNLHVGVINDEDKVMGEAQHQRYMDCAVKAWRSATAVYADIFEALADVTAAEPNEGRAERHGHADFAEMARLADEANKHAKKFKLYEEVEMEKAQAAAAGEVEMKDADDDSSDDSSSSSGSVKDYVHPDRKALGEGEKPDKPDKSDKPKMSKKEKQAWTGAAKERRWVKLDKQMEKRREKRKELKKEHLERTGSTTTANPVVPDRTAQPATDETKSKSEDKIYFTDLNGDAGVPVTQSNGVQYEDVSAEVDARMEAKNKARETKKQEKKRKRESGEYTYQTPAEKHAEIKAKKAKTSSRSGGAAFREAKHPKRAHKGEDAGDGESRKKQKKSKS